MAKNATVPEITPKAQQGIDRFAELVEEYKRMKGVHGDVVQLSAWDLWTGILADSFHWARLAGIDAFLASGQAYALAMREATEPE